MRPEQHQNIQIETNGLKNALRIIMFALQQSLSDGYGIKMSVLLLLLNRLEANPQDVASNSLVVMFANMCVIASSAPLFAINSEISQELVIARREELTPEQRQAAHEKITRTTTSAALYTVLACIPTTTSLIFSSAVLQHIFRQDQYKADKAQEFLRYFAIGVPATITAIGVQQIAFSAKKLIVILPSSAILAVSLLAAAALGYGWGELPKWGKTAVISAYVIEAFFSVVLFVAFLKFTSKLKPYQFLSREMLNLNHVLSFLKVGAWPAITVFCELMFGFGLTAMSARFGDDEQAAVGIAYHSLWLNTFMAIKLSIAAMVTLGRVYGKLQGSENYDAARSILRHTAACGVITTSVLCAVLPILFAIKPKTILSMFGHVDPAIQNNVEKLAPFFAVGFISDAVSFSALFQSRVLGDNVASGILRAGSFDMPLVL